MQRAQDSSTELVPRLDSPRTGLSPAIAFLLLAVVVALLAAAILLTRPEAQVEAAATNPTSTAPNFALTNEEAIARFKELHQMRVQAYRSLDAAVLPRIYESGSEVLAIALNDLRRLSRDGVRDTSIFRTKSLAVMTNESDEVTIEQVVDVAPRFVSRGGKEVTTGPREVRRHVLWTLSLQGTQWVVADAVVTRAVVVRD